MGAIPLGLLVLARTRPFLCPACAHPFYRLLGGELSSADRCEHCEIAIGTPLNPRLPTHIPSRNSLKLRRALAALVSISVAVVAWAGAFTATVQFPRAAGAVLLVVLSGGRAFVLREARRQATIPRLAVLPLLAIIVGGVGGVRERRALDQEAQQARAFAQMLRARREGCPPFPASSSAGSASATR